MLCRSTRQRLPIKEGAKSMRYRMRLGPTALSALILLAAPACDQHESNLEPVAAVPAIPQFQTAPRVCLAWSCSSGTCGYDTATDPRGSCCLEWVLGTSGGQPKQSCGQSWCQRYPSLCGSQANQGGTAIRAHRRPQRGTIIATPIASALAIMPTGAPPAAAAYRDLVTLVC